MFPPWICFPLYFSPEVGEYCREFVCCVILGDDIITRQGMLMMDDLKMQILEAIKECQIPKVNIIRAV